MLVVRPQEVVEAAAVPGGEEVPLVLKEPLVPRSKEVKRDGSDCDGDERDKGQAGSPVGERCIRTRSSNSS